MSLLTNLGLTNMCLKLKINLYRSTHRCMMCIPLKYESHLDIGLSYPDRLHLTRMSTHIVKYPNLMCRYGLDVAVLLCMYFIARVNCIHVLIGVSSQHTSCML